MDVGGVIVTNLVNLLCFDGFDGFSRTSFHQKKRGDTTLDG